MQATATNNSQANSQPAPVAPKANGKATGKGSPKAPAKQPKAKGNGKAKANPVTVTAPTNRPGPKAGQQRVTVLGYSLYGFSQWLGSQGYSYPVAQAVITKLAQNGNPNWATVKTAYSDFKNPKYCRIAPVTPAHAQQVSKLAGKASKPAPAKAPAKARKVG